MVSYRKKPITVEAVRITATDFNPRSERPFDSCPFTSFPKWVEEGMANGTLRPITPGSTDYAEWEVRTNHGVTKAGPGDWLIRNDTGEIYPCSDAIFKASYDEADAPRKSVELALAYEGDGHGRWATGVLRRFCSGPSFLHVEYDENGDETKVYGSVHMESSRLKEALLSFQSRGFSCLVDGVDAPKL